MENASKALLIAAAVLIVIIIIAVSMKIYNSSGDTASDAQKVGDSIADKSSGAAQELVNIFEKNLVRIKDQTIEVTGGNNGTTFPVVTNVIMKPNEKYLLKFDYEIVENDKNIPICCGWGSSNGSGEINGNFYYVDGEKYPSYSTGKKGTFQRNVLTTNNWPEEALFVVRLVRTRDSGAVKVKISNVKLFKTE